MNCIQGFGVCQTRVVHMTGEPPDAALMEEAEEKDSECVENVPAGSKPLAEAKDGLSVQKRERND